MMTLAQFYATHRLRNAIVLPRPAVVQVLAAVHTERRAQADRAARRRGVRPHIVIAAKKK